MDTLWRKVELVVDLYFYLTTIIQIQQTWDVTRGFWHNPKNSLIKLTDYLYFVEVTSKILAGLKNGTFEKEDKDGNYQGKRLLIYSSKTVTYWRWTGVENYVEIDMTILNTHNNFNRPERTPGVQITIKKEKRHLMVWTGISSSLPFFINFQYCVYQVNNF